MKINLAEQRASFNEVYVIDFGDDYHRTIKPASELEAQARKIRRRYRTIKEYLKAKIIYKEYMESIYSAYPSREIAKIMLAGGNENVFIPPKPRMKNNTEKKFYDKGIILDTRTPAIDYEKIEKIMEQLQETPISQPCIISEDTGNVKGIEKVIDGIGKHGKEKQGYKRGGKRKFKGSNDFDLLKAFYDNNGLAPKDEEDEYAPDKPYSMKAIVSDDKTYEKLTGNYENPDAIIQHKGRYIKRSRAEEMKIFDTMSELGWDSLRLMNNMGASKRLTAIAKREAKAMAKRDKMRRKRDKKVFGMAGGDYDEDDFGHVNIHSFDDLEDEMMSMTTSDLINTINNKSW